MAFRLNQSCIFQVSVLIIIVVCLYDLLDLQVMVSVCALFPID